LLKLDAAEEGVYSSNITKPQMTEEMFDGQVFYWMATGCSGDCTGGYLSAYALNNGTRNSVFPPPVISQEIPIH